ncbi:MAG: hypothetical protein HDR92_05075 [Bacteroides sp.]|nr:hypothetical protein [Bacteroides sp.]
MNREIEIEAADALLDVGVSLPLLRIRLPFRRKPVQIRLTMRRPCLGNQIRIARLYLETGVTHEEMSRFSKHEELAFLALHGKRISRMVALTICRGKWSGWILTPIVAWILRWMVDDLWIQGANMRFISLLGTKSFMNIIGSVERVNPLTPRSSQRKRGS